MNEQEKRSRGLLNRKKSVCSLIGCNKHTITLKLSTFHDNESPDRPAQFCCISHCITWLLIYQAFESSNWTLESKDLDQEDADSIEAVVEEMMHDMAHSLKLKS